MRKYRYVLKGDVRKYFASIDHEILNAQLARAVKCKPTLNLARRVIAGSNPQEEVVRYYPGDDLFTPFERRRGLPLGNQTSQFFANVYLNGVDHRISREFGAAVYARYVDDLALFSDSRMELRNARQMLDSELLGLRLEMHPGKSRIYRCADGLTFLGWRLFPDRARLVRGNVVRFRQGLLGMRHEFEAGRLPWERVRQGVEAWIAHAEHGDTWRLRERILDSIAFRRRGRGGS